MKLLRKDKVQGKKAKKKKRAKRFLIFLEYPVALAALAFLRVLPFGLAMRLGGLLAKTAFMLGPRHRAVILGNLRSSFPGMGEEEIEKIAASVYENLGYSLIEFIHSKRFAKDPDRYVAVTNYPAYQAALAKGRGVLLLTAHCGNWELMALWQSIKGAPINVVARHLDNHAIDRLVNDARTRYGNKIIYKKNGLREILKALDSGEAVGILLDQNVNRKNGVFVDFFGRPACTNKGMALIAARSKAPVVPAFIRRVGRSMHEIVIGEEIPLIETGDKEADVIANTQAYTAAIERFVRANPDQWFWMHRRWKTRPEGD